jgi:uncharacterized membrane protein
VKFLQLFLAGIPVFIAGDLLWLGVFAKDFYQGSLGGLLAASPNWLAAGLFYLVFLAGLTYFATYPAYKARSIKQAVLAGALFGFFAYATYDLTNWATLKDWPVAVTFVDMAWGAFLCALVSWAAVAIVRRFS